MSLLQDRAQDLLDPHRHLPAYALLLLCSPIPPGWRTVFPMPARRVPQNTPNGVKAFLTEDLNEARDALSLYLFQDLEAMKGPTPPGVGR